MEAPPDHVAAALFRFGQALTKIHDLTFPSRDRVESTFCDDLRGLLFTMLDEDNVDDLYAGAKRRLEEVGVGGGDTVPAQGVQECAEMAGCIEPLGADAAPCLTQRALVHP